ncbi:MAG: Na(+)/H(+) antiporter NhaD [Candidatus Heimdallarchaeota archaeon LC_3]|nr:MAG: Na(+)/H(+) antiporter NhaD [Candidatus Heimdallarchaeota archaeon LC_3]
MVLFTGEQIIFALLFGVVFLFITFYEEKKLMIVLFGVSIVTGVAYILIEDFSFEGTFSHIDWEVILILFSMSLLVEALIELRIFDFVSLKILIFAKGSTTSLHIIFFVITFFISAFLDNITAIILMGRLTLSICKGLHINPKGFILSEIFATELAGISSPVSSLPSIIIGVEGELSFIDFFLVNGPLLVIIVPLSILWFYYLQIHKTNLNLDDLKEEIRSTIDLALFDFEFIIGRRKNIIISVVVLFFMILGFIIVGVLPKDLPDVSIAYVALSGAVLLIILTRQKMDYLITKVHWESIIFFIGLFLLVGILEQSHFITSIASFMIETTQGDVGLFGLLIIVISAPLSAIVDNIPTTAALAPIIIELSQTDPNITVNSLHFLWFILLSSVTFGAGFTPIGSATSIIGLGMLRADGIKVNLKEFVKMISLLSLIMLLISSAYYFLIFRMIF